MSQQLALGRNVIYTLAKGDVAEIVSRRGVTGARGSEPATGDRLAATVVRVHGESGPVNLKVELDGDDFLWREAVFEGRGPGMWEWPLTASPTTGEALSRMEAAAARDAELARLRGN